MFNDIVANTNPILAALPSREELVTLDLYQNHATGFFSAKQNLLRNYNLYKQPNDCLSCCEERDKLDCEEEDIDKVSFVSEDYDVHQMLDFMSLRPLDGQLVGGVY